MIQNPNFVEIVWHLDAVQDVLNPGQRPGARKFQSNSDCEPRWGRRALLLGEVRKSQDGTGLKLIEVADGSCTEKVCCLAAVGE